MTNYPGAKFYLLFLMLDQVMRANENVAREELAGVNGLATTILAARNVELVLTVVVRLVVIVERAQEDPPDS